MRTPTRTPQDRARRVNLAAAAAGAAPPPSPWAPPPGTDSQLQRAGMAWEAVRAPAYLGDRALTRLGDAQGAVIRDGYRHYLYWLTPLASGAGWLPLPHVEVYGPACWVEVPPAGRTHGMGPYWARPPGPGRLLTQPDALHAALAHAVAAVFGPRPEAAR